MRTRVLREEAAGSQRKLHNEELLNLYISPKEGDVAHITDMINVYKMLVGKTEGKRSLG
jgi:hypothetical protein